MNYYNTLDSLSGFSNVSETELMEIAGGVNWEAVANAALAVAVISSSIPGGQGVTIVCGCFAAGYYIGKAIK